ncbi:MAG: choice-of-anchor L domain-containing protein [Spirochaetia bacterium]|nr:choice-of-anchor L domain-containing protein [Spirochaetia bacterium]
MKQLLSYSFFKYINIKKMLLFALSMMFITGSASLRAIEVTGETNANNLVNYMLGSGIIVVNATLTGHSSATGTFTAGSDSIGFESGIVLSSGSIQNVPGPNKSDGISQSNGLPGDFDLNSLVTGYSTYDATVLEFDFIPEGNVISFQYVFSSDEYNEYANTSFNDVFGFFLNGQNIALIPGSVTPVSINTVNNGNPFGSSNAVNPEYYVNNDLTDGGGSVNIEMDGLTVVLSVQANVVPGQVNRIKLAIADAGDSILDSNVFIKAKSFTDKPVVIDSDLDGIADTVDNCPMAANADQSDWNNNGVGDACDNANPVADLEFSKITGGGGVEDFDGSYSSKFGFNLTNNPEGLKVNLEYNDNRKGKASDGQSPLQVKLRGYASDTVSIITDHGKGVEFLMPCTVRTLVPDNAREINMCRVRIVDNGSKKSGSSKDEFNIQIIDGPSSGYNSGKPEIVNGNIKLHK